MRCIRHPSDLSSGVGVCASCLRERLFALIAAQARRQQAEEDRRKADAHPPPLVFPRSVSPYICRRSDDSSWHHGNHHLNDRRFYSTPQIGPTTTADGGRRRSRHGKFSILSSLFRSSRSEDQETDPRVWKASALSSSSSSSPISSSWFSSLLPGRRKKQSRLHNRDDAAPSSHRRHCRTRDRGMSPTVVEEDYEDDDRSPSASGCSSESSPGWRKSVTAPLPRRRGPAPATVHCRNVSGLAFCLSPLVRASPKSHWCQKESSVPGMGISGEIARSSAKPPPQLSTAATFCANRSRKLAHFGRYNNNYNYNYNP